MSVADQVRAWRSQMGMSQKEFGKMVGVRQGTISHWELGKCEPQLDNLRALSDALGLDMGELAGESVT